MICKPTLLKAKLISLASKFLREDLLKLADLNKGDWIIDVLSSIKPWDSMGIDCRAGLISLMTLLGGKSLEQIPLFLADMDQPCRIEVINKYEKVLKYFFKS